jgi:hypothetical protein
MLYVYVFYIYIFFCSMCVCVYEFMRYHQSLKKKKSINYDSIRSSSDKKSQDKTERMLARSAARRFFSAQKRTTGLVGVQVLENPRDSLIDIYQKTLDTIKVCYLRKRATTRRKLTHYSTGFWNSQISTILQRC